RPLSFQTSHYSVTVVGTLNRRTPNGFSGGVGGKIDERFSPLIYLPDLNITMLSDIWLISPLNA
ncbi:MAG: hypothetical protein IKF00_05950, partial [Solobacterium sp.]|nr:hypothetical protein [Solobacterium sp.]